MGMEFFKRSSLCRVDAYVVWTTVAILGYLIANLFFAKGMFPASVYVDVFSAEDYLDGFHSGIHYTDIYPYELNILSFTHRLRYIVAYPFWWLFKNGFSPVWEGFVLLLYMAPALLLRVNKTIGFLRFGLLLLPFFLSYRTCLTIVSITVLFFYINGENKKGLTFLFSALLSNLSSGVVLPYLALIFIYRRVIQINKSVLVFSFCILFGSIFGSLSHKISFFSNQDTYKPKAELAKIVNTEEVKELLIDCGNNAFCNAASRNTIYISYITKRYDRALVYVGLFFLYIGCWWYCLRNQKPLHWFFAFSLPGFFFEGLWVISFSIPALLLLGMEFEKKLRKLRSFNFQPVQSFR